MQILSAFIWNCSDFKSNVQRFQIQKGTGIFPTIKFSNGNFRHSRQSIWCIGYNIDGTYHEISVKNWRLIVIKVMLSLPFSLLHFRRQLITLITLNHPTNYTMTIREKKSELLEIMRNLHVHFCWNQNKKQHLTDSVSIYPRSKLKVSSFMHERTLNAVHTMSVCVCRISVR